MVINSNTLDFLFLQDGEDGAQGASGKDGQSLYTWVKYSQYADGTDMTDNPTNAKYIGIAYNKTSSTESSNKSDYAWSLIKGNDGANGKDGSNGKDGKDAYTIILSNENVSFSVDTNNYPLSNQSTQCNVLVYKGTTPRTDYTIGTMVTPTGIGATQSNKIITVNVSTTVKVEADSGYITVPIAIDGITFSKTIAYSLSKQGIQGIRGLQGEKGEQGIQGQTGKDGKTSYFHIKYSSVEKPTSTSQMTETPSTYIGTYVDYTSTDSTDPSAYTWARFVGMKGDQGIAGTNGANGETSYLHIKYSDVANPTSSSQINDTGGAYIGQYVDFSPTDSIDPSVYTWTKIRGEDGKDGVSIKNVINYYLATDKSSGVTKTTSGWSVTIQNISATKQYLWNYEQVLDGNNNEISSTNPVIIGRYGRDGTNGTNGTNGKDGRGIVNITEYYATSTSKTSVPTKWYEAVQTTDATNKYLWNYEVVTYTTGSPEETAKRIIGVYGDTGAKGDKGDKGDKGTDGTSVTITAKSTTYGKSSSQNEMPTSWSDAFPIVSEGEYLWTKTVVTFSDGTSATNITFARQGVNGKDGITLVSSKVEYMVSDNGSELLEYGYVDENGAHLVEENNLWLTDFEWLEDMPVLKNGEYLWTRITRTYSDDSIEVSYSVGYNGVDGTNGRSISSTTTLFCISTSNEQNNHTRADGTYFDWTEVKPADIAETEYIWIRYRYDYDDGTIDYSNDIYDATITGVESILDTQNRTIRDSVWEKTYVTVVDSEGQLVSKAIKEAITESTTDINGLTTRVSVTEGAITQTENKLTTVETVAKQTASDFSWFVTGHASSSNLALTAEGLTLIGNGITVKSPDGKTTFISGGKITTNNLSNNAGTSWINFASGTFNYGDKLTWDGEKLSVSGDIVANTLTAIKSGKISSWNFDSNAIYKGNSAWGTSGNGNMYLGNDGISISNTFKVNNKGEITATSGNIGGLTVNGDSLYMADTGISSNTSKFAFWAGETNNAHGASTSNAAFKVGHDGHLIATGASITGEITAISGNIGGFVITNTDSAKTLGFNWSDGTYNYWCGLRQKGGSASATTGSIRMFEITRTKINESSWESQSFIGSDGRIYSKNAYIVGGTIGGFTISSTQLVCTSNSKTTGIQAANSGVWSFAAGATDVNDWSTAPFRVSHNGEMYSTAGNIGGFRIDGSGIFGDKLSLYSVYDGAGIILEDTGGTGTSIEEGYASFSYENSWRTTVGADGVSTNQSVTVSTSNGSEVTMLSTLADNGLYVTNKNARSILFLNNNSNNSGIYNATDSRWIFRHNTDSDVTYIHANSYAIRIGAGDTAGTQTFMARTKDGNAADGNVHCGSSKSRWHTVWSVNGVKTSSDERIKKIYRQLGEAHKNLFMELKPIEYSFVNDLGKKHFGLGAQTTIASMEKLGFGSEYDVVEHSYYEGIDSYGRNETYSINYTEALMLAIPVVQEHEREIAKLKSKISELENELLRIKK